MMSSYNARIYMTYMTKTLQKCLTHEPALTIPYREKFSADDFLSKDRVEKFNNTRIKYLFLLSDKCT